MTRTSRLWSIRRSPRAHDRIKVVALTVIAGTGGPQKATITLDIDGKQHTLEFDRRRAGGRDLQGDQGDRAA